MKQALYGLLWIALAAPSPSFSAQTGDGAARPVPNILVIEKRPYTQRYDIVDSAKVPLPASDLPLSAEIVARDLIENTGFETMGGLLQATTSAVANPVGGVFDDLMLRGFSDTRFYRNGVNDSLGQAPARSLANVERIEVLKGPYGALYGPGQPGGSINYVTKRPEPEFAHELAAAAGSYGAFALDLDSTGPVGNQADLQYRMIASRKQSGTFRDFVKHNRWFAAPSLVWRPVDKVELDASFEYLHDEQLLDSGVIAVDGGFPLPHSRFIGEPGAGPAEVEGLTLQLSSKLRLNPAWEFDLSLTGQRTRLKGDTVEPADLQTVAGGLLVSREARRLSEQTKSVVGQAEAAGVMPLWGSNHYLVFGLEATVLDEDVASFASDSDTDPFAIDPFKPRYGQLPPALGPERNSREETRQLSIYAQDLWAVSERWHVLFAGRYDYIDQSGSDTVAATRFKKATDKISPRLGVVYKPVDSFSWFASYSRSIDPNEGLQPDGGSLSPTVGESIETGVKWGPANGQLSFDAAAFAIRQTDVTTEAPGNPGFEIQTAEQENVGFDLELRVVPAEWLSIRARYNYLDSEIKKDPVIRDGTAALNVPKHQFTLIGMMKASIRGPHDLKFGLLLSHLGKRQGSLEPEELNLELPGYTRVDAFASWEYSDRVMLQLQLRNLSDDDYIQSSQSDALSLTPGEPLSVRGQIGIAF